MQLSPYLFFADTCEAAFRFYQQCLGGEIVTMMNHGESPIAGQTPLERHRTILHARLDLPDGQVLMGSDAPPEFRRENGGFSLSLGVKQLAEAERLYQALSQGGTVTMPLQPTFWSAGFAMLTDRFGTPWMINCEIPA